MDNIRLIDHLHNAVAVIDKNMNIVDANRAYLQRSEQDLSNIIGTKCFQSAYQFNKPCNSQKAKACALKNTFTTKESFSKLHHYWIEDHAVVEEITTSPIIEKNNTVQYVVEEFRDITELLGLKKGIIRTCSYCKKIRDEDGQWLSFEDYLQKHTGAYFSHGICGECTDILLEEEIKQNSLRQN